MNHSFSRDADVQMKLDTAKRDQHETRFLKHAHDWRLARLPTVAMQPKYLNHWPIIILEDNKIFTEDKV